VFADVALVGCWGGAAGAAVVAAGDADAGSGASANRRVVEHQIERPVGIVAGQRWSSPASDVSMSVSLHGAATLGASRGSRSASAARLVSHGW
jgi:hypothetical protein